MRVRSDFLSEAWVRTESNTIMLNRIIGRYENENAELGGGG